MQTNPWHREEKPYNNHETPGRQTKQRLKIGKQAMALNFPNQKHSVHFCQLRRQHDDPVLH